MKRKLGTWTLALLLNSGLCFSAPVATPEPSTQKPATQVVLAPESKLWLIGDSTLHAYSATATELEFNVDVQPASENIYEAIKTGGLKSLQVKVAVTGLKSGKAQMDKNMYKALKAVDHPHISYLLNSYTVSPSSVTGQFNLSSKGDLTIAGQTKPVDIEATVIEGETVIIKGNRDLLMTEYGVKPPTIMGAIRTHNRVVVNFDLRLTKN
ncbi:MAG: hypothetical protein KCHDKBKB_01376 [Elusimicrobia bacterium]|nr:hypothetical protein [Elusimicrobiota bacterium]